MIYQLANWISIFCGAVAALYWYKSSIAQVDAPPGTQTVGSVLGGNIFALSKGKYIDLVESLQLQSKLNGIAAVAACLASISQIVAWLAQSFSWA